MTASFFQCTQYILSNHIVTLQFFWWIFGSTHTALCKLKSLKHCTQTTKTSLNVATDLQLLHHTQRFDLSLRVPEIKRGITYGTIEHRVVHKFEYILLLNKLDRAIKVPFVYDVPLLLDYMHMQNQSKSELTEKMVIQRCGQC